MARALLRCVEQTLDFINRKRSDRPSGRSKHWPAEEGTRSHWHETSATGFELERPHLSQLSRHVATSLVVFCTKGTSLALSGQIDTGRCVKHMHATDAKLWIRPR